MKGSDSDAERAGGGAQVRSTAATAGQLIRHEPRDRKRQLAENSASTSYHDSATDLGQPADAHLHIAVGDSDDDGVVGVV